MHDVYNRANPNCDLNMLEQNSGNMMSELFVDSYPLVAVSGDVSGFCLYEVDVETWQIRVRFDSAPLEPVTCCEFSCMLFVLGLMTPYLSAADSGAAGATLKVSDCLSREAVDTRIERGGICPPLFIHSSVDSNSSDRIADMRSEEQKHVHYQIDRWKDMVKRC